MTYPSGICFRRRYIFQCFATLFHFSQKIPQLLQQHKHNTSSTYNTHKKLINNVSVVEFAQCVVVVVDVVWALVDRPPTASFFGQWYCGVGVHRDPPVSLCTQSGPMRERQLCWRPVFVDLPCLFDISRNRGLDNDGMPAKCSRLEKKLSN